MNNEFCPYCKSKDVEIWEKNDDSSSIKYRCYQCGRFFDISIESYHSLNDNSTYSFLKTKKLYPLEIEEHKKFKHLPKITKDDIVNWLIDLFKDEKKK